MSNSCRMGLTLALLAVPLWACSKNDDASKAAAVPPMTGAPAPTPAPAATPTAPAPTPAPPPPERSAAPPHEASAGGAGPSQGPDKNDPNATITGQITLPAAMKSHVAPTDTLFLVARRISDAPGIRGSLVAVKKLSATKFPIDFTMSAADMPFQGGAFEGELTLSIRDDKDNDPMTRLKGDVFGTLPKVKVGARGVKLPLAELQKEDESLAQPGANPHGAPMGMPGAMPPGHP